MLLWTLALAAVPDLFVVVGMGVVVGMYVEDGTGSVLVVVETGKLLKELQSNSSYESISSCWSVETVTTVLSSSLAGVYKGL